MHTLPCRWDFLAARGWTKLAAACCNSQTTSRATLIDAMERATTFAATSGIGKSGQRTTHRVAKVNIPVKEKRKPTKKFELSRPIPSKLTEKDRAKLGSRAEKAFVRSDERKKTLRAEAKKVQIGGPPDINVD